jgi:glycosyltransferase involved in cell wall biosynthesis
MALGKPVVSTAVGFLAEPGPLHALGLVVANDDDEAMTRALESLLEDETLAQRAGETASEMVEREFASEEIHRRFMAFYAEVMEA